MSKSERLNIRLPLNWSRRESQSKRHASISHGVLSSLMLNEQDAFEEVPTGEAAANGGRDGASVNGHRPTGKRETASVSEDEESEPDSSKLSRRDHKI